MIKYIINSGGLINDPQKAKEFFKETVKGLGSKPNILLCFFANKRDGWERKFVDYKENLKKELPNNISPIFELALPDKFVVQTKNSDAIIIYGGDDYLLQYWLKQFDIPKIWKNKTIATISAGSDVLSKHFWTCDWRHCVDGLGIIPIKFLPHYKSDFGSSDPRGEIDWEKAHKELEECGDRNIPIHALKEGEFIVIEQ
ncbi:Type 1 glutamine amidotransferase-like domain-containing protein [Patescibacteria group bacterium]